ncbi:hypothetical protein GM541_14770 [Streptococcus pneumoniae]|nr:hypothetical protein [Streptococcus pneumoniae]
MKISQYSKATMKRVIANLPRGSREEIAKKTNLSINQVSNHFYGKQYNEKVAIAINKIIATN